MSMKRQVTVTCPGCGHRGEKTIWESLNGDLDPEAKEELLEGRLFASTCDQCKSTLHLDYPILYHDMTNGVMIQYVQSEAEIPKAIESYLGSRELVVKLRGTSGFVQRYRVVTTQNALREKALIFDHQLDDRVIEMMKLLYYSQMKERFADMQADEILFLVDGNEYYLHFLSGEPIGIQIDMKMYRDLQKAKSKKLGKVRNESYRINMDWALTMFKK